VAASVTGAPWPDEPDEPDPEDRWPDPERELPSVPSVDAPAVGVPRVSTPEADVDPDVRQAFWRAVVLANVGVAGVTVGPLVAYFRDELLIGAGFVAVGALALARTYRTVRAFQASAADRAADGEGGAADAVDHQDRARETVADGDGADADADPGDPPGTGTGGDANDDARDDNA
jgi:hypothetical protein